METTATNVYALAHAFLGTSFAARLNGKSGPEIIRLREDQAKEDFATSLTDKDVLFLELGGSADKIALVASMRGARVMRIPTFTVGDKEACEESLRAMNWSYSDEKAFGSETGDKLTARKMRAMSIAALSIVTPGSFLEQREEEQRILRLKHLYRSFRMMQKIIMANYLRLISVYRDRYLLESAKTMSSADLKINLGRNKVNTAVTLMAINALLTEIPDTERANFVAKLGLDKLKGKQAVPRKTVAGMLKMIVDALLESTSFSPFIQAMAQTKKDIEKLLKTLPVYMDVFEPLPGCGPLISARIMATIVDIRRFESLPDLKAYAGYHHFEDGSRARRVTGKVSDWSPELKQAVYLWCNQTLKMPQSPWRAKLDQRRAFELYKILVDRQLKAMDVGLDIEILPGEFEKRIIKSVEDISLADLGILAAHVDVLRLKAGIKAQTEDEEDAENGTEAEPVAKDPKLAKLVRGVKMQALQKAMRWLGQKLLTHIYKEWRKSLNLSEFPVREPKPKA